MRALREATHTTNIDSTSQPPNGFAFPSSDLPETSKTTSSSTFQPIFNWGKSHSSFSSRFNHPITPGYAPNFFKLIPRTPTMQGMTSNSILSEESPTISTPLEMMKPWQKPSSRLVDNLRGKSALRSVRETVQV